MLLGRELFDDGLDLLADLDDFFWFSSRLIAHFDGGQESIYARIDLDKCTKALDLADGTVDGLSFVKLVFDLFPWIRLHLLEGQADMEIGSASCRERV